MKTQDSVRPTIADQTLFWRAAAALVALVALLVSISVARLAWPVAQAPAANPSAPVASGGSAHEGSAYVEYPLRAAPIETTPSITRNPNTPVIGTGSVYDGGAYEIAQSAAPSTGAPTARPTVATNPNTPNIGTGSAYDGGAYQSVPASSQP
jgi:hypothetical protein